MDKKTLRKLKKARELLEEMGNDLQAHFGMLELSTWPESMQQHIDTAKRKVRELNVTIAVAHVELWDEIEREAASDGAAPAPAAEPEPEKQGGY